MQLAFISFSTLGITFLAMLALMGPLSSSLPDWVSVALFGLAFVLALTVSILASEWLETNLWYGNSVDELESQGLVSSTNYQALRAFMIPPWEDEDAYYFLELNDGSVIHLTGDPVYEDDDSCEELFIKKEDREPRLFPCTEFTVKRHRERGEVLQVVHGGQLLKLDEVGEYDINTQAHWPFPRPGDIILNPTFDEMKISWFKVDEN
jgi:hypothetical protein